MAFTRLPMVSGFRASALAGGPVPVFWGQSAIELMVLDIMPWLMSLHYSVIAMIPRRMSILIVIVEVGVWAISSVVPAAVRGFIDDGRHAC